MITPGTSAKLPAAYLPYRITGTVLGFFFLFLIVGGFILLASSIASSPGATETVNGVPVPATPFSAAPFIGIAALVAGVLVLLGIVYQFLFYSMFSFVVGNGQLTVTSGVLFTSDKSTQFEDVQTVSVKHGPILRMFGLAALQGFTSSPDQIQVHSTGKGGSYTTFRPDINLILTAEDAESLRAQIGSSINKVQVVAPAA